MSTQDPCSGACGAPCPRPVRPPTPEQPPDLDLRPGEPARSTLKRWVCTCRHCGACAEDLATLPGEATDIVASPDYAALDAQPRAVQPFLRWAMLCPDQRSRALLQAAWIADDAGDDTSATRLRGEAAAIWGGIASAQSGLQLLDVQRRAGNDSAVLETLRVLDAMPLDETSQAVLKFQKTLLAGQDTAAHRISAALAPPAHRPHVTHVQPRRRSLWQRLTGR